MLIHKKTAVSVARSEDIPTCASIINQAYAGKDDLGGTGCHIKAKITIGPRINLDKNEELINRESQCVFKYEENGDILGCVLVKVTEQPKLAYVGTLSVQPSFQSKGVGRVLLAAAENWAKEKGCTRMKLTVLHIRTELIEYYKRRGYQDNGETEAFPDNVPCTPLVPVHVVVLEKSMD